jgi:ribosomal protein S18 acetylase RimI-like enzyme
MEIIEYNSKYVEDAKDLLTELEEYIVSIDEDKLDHIGENYREEMIKFCLKDVEENNGKCFIAVEDDKAIGLIMGFERKYKEMDYLDYKCPPMGIITELIVSKKVRSKSIGTQLMNRMEEYFKSIGCEYVLLSVFEYNRNAQSFYSKFGYHPRMRDMIRKL